MWELVQMLTASFLVVILTVLHIVVIWALVKTFKDNK